MSERHMKTAEQWQQELAGETSLEAIRAIQADARREFAWKNADKERPTIHAGEVLCQLSDGRIIVGELVGIGKLGELGELWCQRGSMGKVSPISLKVTHWRPLPEPAWRWAK